MVELYGFHVESQRFTELFFVSMRSTGILSILYLSWYDCGRTLNKAVNYCGLDAGMKLAPQIIYLSAKRDGIFSLE